MLSYFIKRDHVVSLYLIAFLVPFNPKFLGSAILIFFMEALLKRNFNSFSNIKKGLSSKQPFIWLILFYAMHFVGMLYSSNTSFGWMDIGMKASFIIFPLLFLIFNFKINLYYFLTFFVAGAFISVVVCIYLSYLNYAETEKIWHFRESYLSHFMHRSYWATYLVFALISTVFLMIKKEINVLIGVFMVLLFLAITIITGSKAGIALMLISGIAILIYRGYETKKWKTLFIIVVSLLLTAIATLGFFPTVKNRITNSVSQIMNPSEYKDQSTSERLVMWQTSWELIKERPLLGFGTGDIKDELKFRNLQKGNIKEAEKNLNSHNQLLNSWVAIGIFGVLFLLLIFLSPFIFPQDEFKLIIRLLAFILFASLVAESFLETQAGIIPTAFLMSVLGSNRLTNYKRL